MSVLLIICFCAQWVHNIFIWSLLFSDVHKNRRTGQRYGLGQLYWNVCLELKWVTIAVTPLALLFDFLYGIPMWLMFICWLGDCYVCYCAYKTKDDDRWKKRRQRAAGKVKEVAGKLVVVPEPETAPVAA